MTAAAFPGYLTPDMIRYLDKIRSRSLRAAFLSAGLSFAANVLASGGWTPTGGVHLEPVAVIVGIVAPAGFILAVEIAAAVTHLPHHGTPGAGKWAMLGLLVLLTGASLGVSFSHIVDVVEASGASRAVAYAIAGVVDGITILGLVGNYVAGLYQQAHNAAVTAYEQAQAAAAQAKAEADEAARVEADRVAAARLRAEAEAAEAQAAADAAAAERAKAEAERAKARAAARPAAAAPTKAERCRATAAANPGWTHEQIAAHVGCNPKTVSRALGEAKEQDTGDEVDTGTAGPSLNGFAPEPVGVAS